MRDPADPVWWDAEMLAAHPVFGRFVDESVLGRLAMGGRVHGMIVGAWALAAGFEATEWPGSVDWHRLRAALEEQ